jgi:RNA polymerase sporulation-specific sigma factor
MDRTPTIEDLVLRAQTGDVEAEQLVFEKNQGLIWSLIQRFRGRADPDDLYQVASLGMLKALRRYDPTFGTKFSTYAVPIVLGELRRYLRDNTTLRVSRPLKELYLKAERKRREMTRDLGREVSLEEVATALDVKAEDLLLATQAALTPMSLDMELEQDDGSSLTLGDRIPGDGEGAEVWDERISLKNALEHLSDRERMIIVARYFRGMTQSEIAQKLGISQVQVSRLEKQILARIRGLLGET